ncbi:MAG: hypothetical protein ACI8P3_000731 [Saprospiraceae bacterium]|jgi:hypothetical protein
MNWNQFKTQLQENPDLRLQFEYQADTWVDASYHLTEIKQAQIVSVDCGGKMNSWTEVVLQLWVPEGGGSESAMQVAKAMNIIDQVENALPIHPNGIVKIEFGDQNFETRQMLPASLEIMEGNLIIKLHADKTQCKAIDRGETCGTPEKKKVSLIGLPIAGEACDPGSGCC